MGKGFEIISKRRYAKASKLMKKMLNFINPCRNANQTHKEYQCTFTRSNLNEGEIIPHVDQNVQQPYSQILLMS